MMKQRSLLRTVLAAVLAAAVAAALCCLVYAYRDTLREWVARGLARLSFLADRVKTRLSREEDDFADL